MPETYIYITPNFENYRKKILGQMSGIQRHGKECYLCTSVEGYFVMYQMIQDNNLIEINSIKKEKFNNRFEKYLEYVIDTRQFDVYYWRRLGIRVFSYTYIFQKIKSYDSKIVYEIPTYPIQKKSSILGNIVAFFEEIYTKKILYRYVDCIPVCCRIKDYSVKQKMIKFENCVDATKFTNINKYSLLDISSNKKVRFLAIAHTQYWHGFDRLIRAIYEWKSEYQIEFTIYGNYTRETYKLINLVEKYNLNDKVFFFQEKDVKDFFEFVKQYNIAVGCLALHRQLEKAKYVALDTSIKNKEYCALGIPFIHSTEDESFDENLEFHFRVSENEMPIDINSIIKWFNSILPKYRDRTCMWNYANENLSHEIFAKQVISRLEVREKNKNDDF